MKMTLLEVMGTASERAALRVRFLVSCNCELWGNCMGWLERVHTSSGAQLHRLCAVASCNSISGAFALFAQFPAVCVKGTDQLH